MRDIAKKVVIINTGGTIAMRLDRATGSVQSSEDQPLHSVQSILQEHVSCEMMDLFHIPSPHMTLEMMLELSEVVQKVLDRDDIAGVVVTHGTDTLEETAYFLDLTVPGDKPVVVTGAMRSSNELGADGPLNLLQSIRVAGAEISRGRGTMVVFNDEIHAAREVTKTHTSNIAAFQSPEHGPIGFVTKKQVTFNQPANRGQVFSVLPMLSQKLNEIEIPILKVVTGMNPKWLQFLLYAHFDGVVLEAFGAGNVPPSIVPILSALIKRNTPVVMVSRCFNGQVQDIYGYEGGGKHLREIGVIFCNELNSQKARIKLIVLLSSGTSIAGIVSRFMESTSYL